MKLITFFGAFLVALGMSVPAYAVPSLSKISCQYNSFTGAGTDACSVYLTGNVPSNTDSIALSSNNPSVVLSTSKAYVTSGRRTGGFSMIIAPVKTSQTAIITASYGGKSVTYGLTLDAVTSAASNTLSAISCQAISFTSQGTDACSANLTAVATANDTLKLTSNNSNAVPTASVSIAKGSTTVGFSVTVAAVTTQQTATITATLGSSAVSYKLTLYPPTVPVQHKVTLSWNAPQPDGDAVAGYHVYRSAGTNTTNFAEISAQSTTSYVDTNVSSGSSYTYVVRSVDSSGVESPNSNTTVVNVPTP